MNRNYLLPFQQYDCSQLRQLYRRLSHLSILFKYGGSPRSSQIPPVSVPAPTAGSAPVPTVAPVAPSRDPRARKEEDISATVPRLPGLTKPVISFHIQPHGELRSHNGRWPYVFFRSRQQISIKLVSNCHHQRWPRLSSLFQ